jgi:hypothetical protein
MILKQSLAASLILLTAAIAIRAGDAKPETSNPYAQWKNGPPKDASWFPIGVCTQDPHFAREYQKAGINLYVDLWKGPTETQLAELKQCGMQVVCNQNAVGLAHKDDPIIVGWQIAEDEPDNAQALPAGKDFGPPIKPAKIIEEYEAIRKADSTRPVFLCLGQGVAWDNWVGRGARTNRPEDYAEYAKACDIAGFDIYPVAHSNPQVKDKLDFVARGVGRLVKWTDGRKPVWNAIECTRIQSNAKATPRQVKAEIWMSLVHGSAGIMYFVHEWKPKFNEHALLDDPEMLTAVTAINKQIRELAPALNSPTVKDALKVDSSNTAIPVAAMMKRQGGATYVFAVAMKPGAAEAAFTIESLPARAKIEVLGEDRTIQATDGKFQDRFADWDVHLYRTK